MKSILLILTLFTKTVYADIPEGKYHLKRIKCTTGTELSLGGNRVKYDVYLEVKDLNMKMTAIAKAQTWANFKVSCTQINRGKFSYVGVNQYEGYLALEEAKCNVPMVSRILRRRGFGVEEQGLSEYSVNGKQLIIKNLETKNLFRCKDEDGIPVYYYQKM